MVKIFNIMVDKIYCISLRERQDRRDKCQMEFDKIGFDNVYYHIVDKSPHGGSHGCTESHIECVKNARENKYKNILIFEDDVYFTNYACKMLEDKSILIPDDYWFFYLGGSLHYADFHSKNIIHALFIKAAHAYMLNEKAYDTILKFGPMNIPLSDYEIKRKDYVNLPIRLKYNVQRTNKNKIIDCFYSKVSFNEKKSYLLYPMIAYQKDDYSNILNQSVDYYDYMNQILKESIKLFKHKLDESHDSAL